MKYMMIWFMMNQDLFQRISAKEDFWDIVTNLIYTGYFHII